MRLCEYINTNHVPVRTCAIYKQFPHSGDAVLFMFFEYGRTASGSLRQEGPPSMDAHLAGITVVF